MLKVERVTKRYGKTVANNDISFEVGDGQIAVLAGPNGAGKSTIIKSIAGLLRFQGAITLDGYNNKSKDAKRILGYIPEMPAIYDLLTVDEHLEFIRRAYKIEDDGYGEKLLERFELLDKKDKLGKELQDIAMIAHEYVNGFCKSCDRYQAAVDSDNDGIYEIGNAGQLYWFAQLVDGGELDANAILTADITVNAAGEERRWNAIGSNSKKYSGTFDGQGFTVSGLFYDNDKTTGGYVGLIASLDEGGVVKNVTVSDSYLCGYRYIGAIVGQNYGGTIENCHNDGTTVTGSGSNIGGIVGGNSGVVELSFNTGNVTGASDYIGGVAGACLGAKITESFNEGSVTGAANSEAVGGVVGAIDGTKGL